MVKAYCLEVYYFSTTTYTFIVMVPPFDLTLSDVKCSPSDNPLLSTLTVTVASPAPASGLIVHQVNLSSDDTIQSSFFAPSFVLELVIENVFSVNNVPKYRVVVSTTSMGAFLSVPVVLLQPVFIAIRINNKIFKVKIPYSRLGYK